MQELCKVFVLAVERVEVWTWQDGSENKGVIGHICWIGDLLLIFNG